MRNRISADFYQQPATVVAPGLLGKYLVRRLENGEEHRLKITETEAYCGQTDLACHACKGKTGRTAIMYEDGGVAYIYLIYGLHFMLNIVSGEAEDPQAVLIRGIEGYDGPAKLTKFLQIDKSFNGENFNTSQRLWVEYDQDHEEKELTYRVTPRIGIDKVAEPYKSMEWRYLLGN